MTSAATRNPPGQRSRSNVVRRPVGLQLKSLISTNNWQLKLHADAVTIGKVGVADYLTISPAGLVTAPNGYAVGPSVGLSTTTQVLAPGPKTNTLVFTKGLLTSVQ